MVGLMDGLQVGAWMNGYGLVSRQMMDVYMCLWMDR